MELKLRKKYSYILYKLNDDNTSIVIEKAVEARDTYKDFVKQLPEDECRYAIFDFEYEKAPGEGIRNKICFIFWVPDTSKVRQKMIYASSKDALRKKLAGVATEIQATDFSEVGYDAVIEKVKSH
jgi:cofilin